MAVFSGKSGTLTVGGSSVGNLAEWSISAESDTATAGHSAASGWTDTKPAMRGWTGSMRIYQDSASAISLRAGTIGALSASDGNNTYAGSVVITNVEYGIGVEAADAVVASVTFTGAGALTIS